MVVLCGLVHPGDVWSLPFAAYPPNLNLRNSCLPFRAQRRSASGSRLLYSWLSALTLHLFGAAGSDFVLCLMPSKSTGPRRWYYWWECDLRNSRQGEYRMELLLTSSVCVSGGCAGKRSAAGGPRSGGAFVVFAFSWLYVSMEVVWFRHPVARYLDLLLEFLAN